MTHLLVEKRLNTRDGFKLHGKFYVPLSEDTKINQLQCRCSDKHNTVTFENVAINDLPSGYTPYIYRITNSKLFERDLVILAYQKDETHIKKVHGIIRVCTPEMISFSFADISGEIKLQGLTGQQIAVNNIVILLYPEPVLA